MANPDSQVTTLDEAPPVITSKLTKAKSMAMEVTAETPLTDDMVTVTIHPTGDESGNDIVDIGINGYLTRIPRGVPVRVSKDVAHVLENAVITTFKVNGDQVIERSTPRFPFSMVSA